MKISTMLAGIILLLGLFSIAYCQSMGVVDLVDRFKTSTDIQRKELQEQYKYQTMDLEGIVQNVKEWKKFDDRTDTGMLYYKVIANPQRTSKGNIYTVSIYYKDVNKVKGISEGQKIKTKGALLNIVDNLDTISISFFADRLNDEDKMLFNKDIVGD